VWFIKKVTSYEVSKYLVGYPGIEIVARLKTPQQEQSSELCHVKRYRRCEKVVGMLGILGEVSK